MLRIPYIKEKNIAIDLGNNNTLLSDGNTLLLSEPSFIAKNVYTNRIHAVGNEAYAMFEKNHEQLQTIKPLKGGVIADYHAAEKMLREMMKKILPSRFSLSSFHYLISGIPYYSTEVEKRALRDALEQFPFTKRFLLYEPLAAAIGMNLNVQEPDGKLIVDIGGGITEIVVISLSGIVSFNSIRIAGDSFDEEIQEYFRKHHNFSIGIKTAEYIKKKIGAVSEEIDAAPEDLTVKGKDMITGIPVSRRVSYKEIFSVLDKPVRSIENTIQQTLEVCPPELAADIYGNGLYLTGGNALLRGLKERFEAKFKIPVYLDEHPFTSVTQGISEVLKKPKKYQSLLVE